MKRQGGMWIANSNKCDNVHEQTKGNVLIANMNKCDNVREQTKGE